MPTDKAFSSSFSGQLALYVGIHLCNILYGVEMYLYFKTITVVFFLVTISVALVWMINEAGWLVDQNHPLRRVSFGYLDFAASICTTLQLLTDGLMIYRCRIVWNSLRAVTIPFILWLATPALGIMPIWIRSVTFTNPFEKEPAKISLVYYTISVSLAAILTCMIVVAPYFNIVMLLVESMLPFSLAGIALLVSFLAGSPADVTILHVFTLMMCISPQMLILRVAARRIWREESIEPLQSLIVFAPEA